MHQGMMALLLAVLMAPVWAAEAYRWRDEHGVWQFSSPEGAPPKAEGFTLADPVVVDMPRPKPSAAPATAAAGKEQASRKTGKKRRRRLVDADDPAGLLLDAPATDSAQRRQLCEKWRNTMLRKRHFDHEEQDAYDRECVLKVHW